MSEENTVVDPDEDRLFAVVKFVADALGERNPHALFQMKNTIRLLGEEKALAYLTEALAIRANGGMMTVKGDRKKTPGGVFLHLVRRGVPPEMVPLLFFHGKSKKPKPEQTAPVSSPKIIAFDTKGDLTTVKITLIGRPATEVVEKEGHIQFVMKSVHVPSLPKGLPAPAAVKQFYVCYIANKQWRTVSQALADDPKDTLILEGFPQGNAANGSIGVFVTSTTTKNSQKAKRPVAS